MTDVHEDTAKCPRCGRTYPAGAEACPECQGAEQKIATPGTEQSEWVRERDSVKLKWVASVLAFWVSAAVLGIVLVLDNRIDLILVSITLGMLVIGIWLKARYHRHLRKEPGRQ